MKKILVSMLLLVFSLILTGCLSNKEDFNCEILYTWFNYSEIVKQEFYESSKVKYGLYDNPYYDDTNPDSERYYSDVAAPSRRLIVVDSIEECQNIFSSAVDVNLDNEILLVYIFADCDSKYKLESVQLNEGLLEIKYKSYNVISTEPEETFMVFKMEKIEFKDVKINNNLFENAYNGGHHHEFIDLKCECGLIEGKLFYELKEAYNNNWVTKVELENTAYYSNRKQEYLALYKDLEEEILNDFAEEYDIDLNKYPGSVRCFYVYEECLAVMVDECGLGYGEAIYEEIIDGVTFTYSNGQTLLVWKRNK